MTTGRKWWPLWCVCEPDSSSFLSRLLSTHIIWLAGSTRSAPFARHCSTPWTSTSTPPPGRARRWWPPSRVPKNQTPGVLPTRWVPVLLSCLSLHPVFFHVDHLTDLKLLPSHVEERLCSSLHAQTSRSTIFSSVSIPFHSPTQSHIPRTNTRTRTHTPRQTRRRKEKEKRGTHTHTQRWKKKKGRKKRGNRKS